MNRLRTAVIGVGALGRHHARILAGFEAVDLVAVSDADVTAGRRVAGDCHTDFVADFQDLYDAVDAVSVVVPSTAHAAVASGFLSRGVATFIEKPIAASTAEAEYLVDLADRHGTLLQVGHIERFNPAFTVARPKCGVPKYIRAERLSPYSFRSTDIGVVHDLMIHDIDLVLDLAGSPVQRVEAFGACVVGGYEDCAQARVTFANGCIADLTASRINPTVRRTLQVWSADRCVYADLQDREVTCYQLSNALRFGTPLPERARQPGADVDQLKQDVFGKFIELDQPAVPAADALTDELASFVDCILENRAPLVGGNQALAAMQVAEQVLAGIAAHQQHTQTAAEAPALKRAG